MTLESDLRQREEAYKRGQQALDKTAPSTPHQFASQVQDGPARGFVISAAVPIACAIAIRDRR